MSLGVAQTLSSLALGQALMVAPALGESYAGRTAGTIAALLLMLAQDVEQQPDRSIACCARLAALLGSAEVGDPALADDIALLLAEPGPHPVYAREKALLAAFQAVHAWADRNDAALARRCRQVLRDRAEGERLHPPGLPGG